MFVRVVGKCRLTPSLGNIGECIMHRVPCRKTINFNSYFFCVSVLHSS